LTVNAAAPFFLQQPPSTIIAYNGLPVSIPAVVGGSQPISFQWSVNGNPVPNGTSQTLTLSAPAAGVYTLAATNAFGGVVSTSCLLQFAGAGQFAFVPLVLAQGSLNQDVVVEKTALPALSTNLVTTASMDGGVANTGNTFYEQGFNRNAPTTGLPPAGSTFVSALDPNRTYRMPPSYTANNAVMIDPAHTNGAFTFPSPAPLAGLSLLGTTSYGPVSNSCTIYYSDGTTQTETITVPDWSGGAAGAFVANGVTAPMNYAFTWMFSGNPRLYQFDIILLNSWTAVTNVALAWLGGNTNAHTVFFGVSGSADLITYTPLTVTGFNQDIVIEATAMPEQLTAATTATYDTGLGNFGNTLYEQGYNTNAPATGMPPAGSMLTNGTHLYLLAPSWQGPNAALIDAQNSATLTLATPAPHAVLSFLTSAGNGPTLLDYTINFSDGTTQTGSFSSPDWFNKTNWVFNADGRVFVDNATFNNVLVTNCNLFGVDVVVSNVSKTITSVGLAYDKSAGGRAIVFALSGSPLLSANPDFGATFWNVPLTVSAVANDTSPSGFPLSIVSVRPTNGTAIISFQTNVVFTPASGFVGNATIGYTITDGNMGSASSLITVAVSAPPTPRINALTTANLTLTMSGTNGAPGGVFTLLRSTNAALPLINWTPVLTGNFDSSGGFSVTNTIDPAAPHCFFLLKQ
jgi:hypothetical protein